MQTFQLDQLFGLALTDSRFFRQLQECPQEAVSGFELTESEAQAVFNIAPMVCSVEELAVELETWRSCASRAPVEVRSRDPIVDKPTLWRLLSPESAKAEITPECVTYELG